MANPALETPETAEFNDLVVRGKMSFIGSVVDSDDTPRFSIENGTINNCQEGGLILKIYACNASEIVTSTSTNLDPSRAADVISSYITGGRNVMTSVARAIAYNRVSWRVDGTEGNTTGVASTFTGYIRPLFAESALMYLTISGTAQLWIDGTRVVSIDNRSARQTITFEHSFTTTDYVPIVLHYAATVASTESALILEWSFPSAPAKTIVPRNNLAYSGSEPGSVILGPISAHGKGVFHDDVTFESNMNTHGDLAVKGTITCGELIGSNGRAVRLDMGTDKKYMQLTGEGLYLQGTENNDKDADAITRDPLLRISASNGIVGLFGMLYDDNTASAFGDVEKHVTLATANEGGTGNTAGAPPPLTFLVGQTAVSTLREASMSISVPLLAAGGVHIPHGDLSVDGDIFTTGQIHQSGKVVFGNGQDNRDIYPEKFVLVGDNGSTLTGPQFATYTSLDNRPLFQLSSFSHDNVSLNFDASYDAEQVLIPSSAYAAQISKTAHQFAIKYGRKGDTDWATAWSIDLTDGTSLFSGNGSVFSHDDAAGKGSIRLAPTVTGGDTSIAFYNSTNMRSEVDGDFYRLGYMNGTFSLSSGTTPLLSVSRTGESSFNGNISATGTGTFLSDLSVTGDLFTKGHCSVSTLSIESDSKDALRVSGSAWVTTNMTVGGRLLTGAVNISSKAPRLIFNSPSTGPRIILTKSRVSSETDIAMGTGNGGSLWLAIAQPSAASAHQWFAGDQLLMSLSGVGDLTLNSQAGDIAFNDVASVSINGSSPNSTLNLGENWSLRTTSDSLVFTEIGSRKSDHDPGLELPVIRIDRNALTGAINVSLPVAETLQLDQGALIANKGVFSQDITATSLVLRGDSSGISHIKLLDRFALLSTQKSSSIHSRNSLEINCSPDAGKTVIHRGNTSPFLLYRGDATVMVVDGSGCTISSTVNVQKGNLVVESGSLTVRGEQTSSFTGPIKAKSGIQLSGNHGISFSETEANPLRALLNYNYNSKAILLQSTEGSAIIRSRTGISLDPGKGDVRVNGTLRVKNAALTEKGVLLASSEGNGICLSSLLGRGQWYYLGKLNTTPNGTGPDETGRLCLELDDCKAKTVVQVTVAHGTLEFGMHEISAQQGPLRPKDTSKVVIHSSNGDFHVFVNVSGNAAGGAYLSIKASVLGNNASAASICFPEGNDEWPDGKESSFNDSFVCVFDSSAAPILAHASFSQGTFTDTLTSTGTLSVRGRSKLDGGVLTNVLAASSESPLLRICSGEKTHVTIGENRVVFGAHLLPDRNDSSHTIDIGSETDPFRNGSFSGIVSVANRVEACRLLISDNAIIEGPLALSATLSVTEGLSTFSDVFIKGTGTILGTLTAKVLSSDSISCRSICTTGKVAVAGSLLFHGDSGVDPLIKVDSGTFKIQATDILLAESLDAAAGIRIAADGSIRSLKNITISCGSGRTISLGDVATRCVHVPGETIIVDGSLTSIGAASFKGELSVSGDVHCSRKLYVDKLLTFGNEIGRVAVSSASLIEWNAGNHVSISVPGIDESVALFKLTSCGDVIVGGNGGLDCSNGVGTFAHLVGKYLTCGDAIVKNSIAIGATEGQQAEFSVNTAGSFTLTVCQRNILEISRQTSVSKFSGDLVASGKLSTRSLQVGDRVRVNNNGILTFSDAFDVTTGRIGLLAPTGVQACAFLFSNPKGDLLFQAAKDRGFSVAAVSGNATFQGQLVIESGLDVDTSMSSDVPTAALRVQGGILVKRSVLIEGSLQLANEDNTRFSISAPSTGNASTTGYNLRLPPSLPTAAGYCCLVSNIQGQLSWKALPHSTGTGTGALLSRSSSQSNTRTVTFTAENNIVDDVVDNFVLSGHSFYVHDFIVTVTHGGDKSRRVAAYELRGIRGASGWKTHIKKTVGDDDMGISFRFLSGGHLAYSSVLLPSWKSTTFTWGAIAASDNRLNDGRTSLGKDCLIGKVDDSYGSFLAVHEATVTRSVEATGAEFWAGTHFGKTQLVDDTPSSREDSFAVTVHIEGAPVWNDPTGKSYSLVVSKGESKFDGPVSVQNQISCKSLSVDGPMTVSGGLCVGSGSELKNVQKGVLHVGPSTVKCATFDIHFSPPMTDVAYTMLGNAVSADPESPDAFACTFKNLTRVGCRVTVCNIISDSWADVTLRVHWFAAL